MNPICGLYALYFGDVLVYVGKSLNVRKRILDHKQTGKLMFDDYRISDLGEEIERYSNHPVDVMAILSFYEAAMIGDLNPRDNIQRPDCVRLLWECPQPFVAMLLADFPDPWGLQESHLSRKQKEEAKEQTLPGGVFPIRSIERATEEKI